METQATRATLGHKIVAVFMSIVLVLGLSPMVSLAQTKAYADDGNAVATQADSPATEFAYTGSDPTLMAQDGKAFGMFTAQEGTTIELDGDEVLITYKPKNQTVYSGFYLGADVSDPTTWKEDSFIAVEDEGATYNIALPATYCGFAWPVAPVQVKDPTKTTASQYYLAIPSKEAIQANIDAAAAVDELIAKIQVQTRTASTDADCVAAKAAWDALTDFQKWQVEEYDYFGLDTGDAKNDNPLNDNNIGNNEILVVSFGTSFNDSRAATIGAVEKALQAAYPDWSVRRAFTAQIIINHVQARDNEFIDNMEQALERAENNGVKNLVVAPTHLMHGAEYDEMVEALEPYQAKMNIVISEPLLGPKSTDPTVINEDKQVVAQAVAAAACADAGYADPAAAAADGAAIVLMGHGTSHEANATYTQMQTQMDKLGYKNVFIGTVEGEPEGTDADTIAAKVKDAGYKKVILRPLMVVAGDHANNDMADPDDPESWYSVFTATGAFDSVACQIKGLGEIPEVQQLYVKHVGDVIPAPTGLTIVNNEKMFKVVTASAEVNADGSAMLTMALSASGYHYLFKGTYEEAVANGDNPSNWIAGKLNAENKWEFQVPIAANEIGTEVPLVTISQSYYEKYQKGENSLARAFYPRQINLNLDTNTLTTSDFVSTQDIKVTKEKGLMFAVEPVSTLRTTGGPNSNEYAATLCLKMDSKSFDKAYVGTAAEAEAAGDNVIPFDSKDWCFDLKVKWVEEFGNPDTVVNLANGEPFVASFHSVSKNAWYERVLVLDEEAGTLKVYNITSADAAAAVDELIAKIQVQVRTATTDADCVAAKEAWDALTADQQELVEEADYFGLDTGDASKDNPLNQDNIGENEILVVSFGTSFNESRVATIGGVEKALQAAFPNWQVRRAFTAQIIINHVQARDAEFIDNMDQALERAVANGVKNLVVAPTHLMHGAEYDEMVEALEPYQAKMNIAISEPLLGEVGATASDINEDKIAVAKAVTAAAVKDAGFDSREAAEAAGTAFVFMGHGTSHTASISYTQMQTVMDDLGYKNVFIGTVEGEPEETACEAVIDAVKAAGYTNVILRPLMVVAGDHANNDMADPDDPESWYSMFTASGAFDSVACQIKGLGEIPEIQQLYVDHASQVVPATKLDPTVKVTAKKNFKAADLKKAKKFKAVKVKTDGKVAYKNVKISDKKQIKFKNGKVTVKKGTAKGKYTIKGKVSATEGDTYNALAPEAFKVVVAVK